MSWGRAQRRFDRAVRKHVVVHTRGGHTIDGILGSVYADGIVVREAMYVRPGDRDVPLDGAQIVPWDSIEWVQELPHARTEIE